MPLVLPAISFQGYQPEFLVPHILERFIGQKEMVKYSVGLARDRARYKSRRCDREEEDYRITCTVHRIHSPSLYRPDLRLKIKGAFSSCQHFSEPSSALPSR